MQRIIKRILNLQYHRLNGSWSPELTTTSRSNGNAKDSTPTESKPLNRLVHNVTRLIASARRSPLPNYTQIRPWGRFSANGWNIRTIFIFIYTPCSKHMEHGVAYIPYFQKLRPLGRFSRTIWLKRRGLTLGFAFWGLKNSKLIYNP